MDPEKKNEQAPIQSPEQMLVQKPAQKERVPIKSLRTYQGDVEEAIAKNNISKTTILVAEQQKKEKINAVEPTPVNSEARNKFFLLAGTIMLVLGIFTVGAIYYMRSTEQVKIEDQTKALLGFSTEKKMVVASSTREQLLTDIISENKSLSVPVNSILFINTTDATGNPENVQDILSLLAPNMPSSLMRSFDSKYMLGIYSFDTNGPFIILTTSDFGSSYSGMLKWESDMPFDLEKIFPLPTDLGTSTPEFKDEAIRNKDLRILQNKDGKTTLVYSFIDKKTLVITTNESILNAIVGKYNISKQVR